MKNAFLCLFLLLITIPTLAQDSYLEELSLPELKNRLALSKGDTDRIHIELALGRAMILKSGSGNKQADSALSFANDAKKLSQKLKYNDGTIDAMILYALCINKKGKTDEGFRLAQQVLKYSRKVKNSRGVAESHILMGNHFDIYTTDGLLKRISYDSIAIAIFKKERLLFRLSSLLKDYAELLLLAERKTDAVRVLFEALNVAKSIGYKQVHRVYWLLGRTSNEMGDFPNAIKFNLLAIKTAKEVQDKTLQLCSIYYTMAVTCNNMNDFSRAIPYSLLALEIAKRHNNQDYVGTVSMVLATAYTRTQRLGKALILLNQIQNHAQNVLDSIDVTNGFIYNLTYAGKYKTAERYTKQVRILLTKISPENYDQVRGTYGVLAQYYLRTKQYASAQYYNDRYAEIVKRINSASGILKTEQRYYELDSVRGNFRSAIDHHLLAQKIKDSIDNVTKAYQVSLLHIENETEQRNNDIETLKKQAELKNSQLKRTQLFQKAIISGSILLFIITALLYSRYRLKQRSNALLLKQKSEIDQQNISLQRLVSDKSQLLQDKDRLLFEKDLLLKEVNHRVKNNLQIVMNLLQSQSVYMSNEGAQQAILESQNRVRSIALIHDQLYKTERITEINLSTYFNELIQSLNGSLNQKENNITLEWAIDDISLDVSQAIPVGIILNEIVTNAMKYAFPDNQAGKISVLVKKTGTSIEMQISDNGVGLPADFSFANTTTLGITLLKGLTAQLKGTFSVENYEGLTIALRFPIEVPNVQVQLLDT